MSTPIKRYDAFAKSNEAGMHVHFEPSASGGFVAYHDHARIVSELHQQMGELEAILIPADPAFDAGSAHETPHARLMDSVKRLAQKANGATGLGAEFAYIPPSKEEIEQSAWQRYFDHYLINGAFCAENASKLADKAVGQIRARCEKETKPIS